MPGNQSEVGGIELRLPLGVPHQAKPAAAAVAHSAAHRVRRKQGWRAFMAFLSGQGTDKWMKRNTALAMEK